MSAETAAPVAPKQSFISKLLRIPPGTNLVWWMIAKQGNPLSQVLALIGFIILFWISFQSPYGAVAMILGMYIHEVGHFVVFVYNKIKAVVFLLFPLGAVAAPINKEEDARSDLLPWWNIGWLLQAGPTMNVVQMVIGLLMLHFGILPELAHQIVYINGMLASFNLIPIANMDGGQLFHVLFSSLKEEYDIIVALIGIIISALIVGFILLSPAALGGLAVLKALVINIGLITFLILFAAGIWHKQGKDNPLHSKSKQAMTVKQVAIQLAYYCFLVVATLFMMTL